MNEKSKKNLLRILAGGVLFIAVAFNLNLGSGENLSESDISIETADAFAQTGTCCSESGSTCVIGGTLTTHAYYKKEGSCKDSPI